MINQNEIQPNPYPPKVPKIVLIKKLLKLRNETFTATNKSNKSYMEITFWKNCISSHEIFYISNKNNCVVRTLLKRFFFYFNLSNFTKNLQTTLINQRIFNMECTRIWGSYLVVNASNNAVISTTNIMQSDTSSCMAITNKNHCYTEWGFRFHFVHKQGM